MVANVILMLAGLAAIASSAALLDAAHAKEAHPADVRALKLRCTWLWVWRGFGTSKPGIPISPSQRDAAAKLLALVAGGLGVAGTLFRATDAETQSLGWWVIGYLAVLLVGGAALGVAGRRALRSHTLTCPTVDTE